MVSALYRFLVLALAAVVVACGGGNEATSLQLPGVLTQPVDQTVTEGAAASFTVSATGSAPLRYQWAVSTDGNLYKPIDGATAASYATTPTLSANGSQYRVVVSNNFGSVTSSAASLRVTQAVVAPSISVQPTDQIVTERAAARFDVTAAGSDLTYQWQVSTDGGMSYTSIADTSLSATLTLATTTLTDSGQRYRVIVSNTLSAVASAAALLTVQPSPAAPVFTTSPMSQAAVVGEATSFFVAVIGTPTPAIHWQLGGKDLSEGLQRSGPCAGATATGTLSATLALTTLPLTCSGATFDAIASNGVSPDATSAVATLTVNPAPAAPQIVAQPANAAALAPNAATFSAAAGGVPTPTVRWQQSSDGGASWANINGATGPSFTTPATQLSDSGKLFRAVFENASGASTTLTATLTVTTPMPVISLLLGDIGGRGNFDGQGSAARFNSPLGIASDGAGNLYVADSGNNLIRKVTPAGAVSTIAGSGASNYADGMGRKAAFFLPGGIAIDASGVIYVADTGNSVIRKIAPDGTVSTLAGLAGSEGSADGVGSNALFSEPQGLAIDSAGTLYVADTGNRSIRKVAPDGTVSTLAVGFGYFIQPTGLALGAAGVVYVADPGLRQILVVSPAGDVSTLAATVVDSGGNAVTASFNQPYGIALDTAGALYIADAADDRVLKILPSGVTTVVAGTQATRGNLDGAAVGALFYKPKGILVDPAGMLRIADTGNQTIRTIDVSGAVSTLAGLPENAGAVDAAGASARFNPITGFAINSAGDIFLPDGHNFTIRKVTRDGVVSTFAGSAGMNGIGDGTDDGTGIAARFAWGTPNHIAIDDVGNLYVDAVSTVRKVTPAAAVSQFAGSDTAFGTADGTGVSAQFLGLAGFATDAAGNVYVADAAAIRKISPGGAVTTLAGIGDQRGTADGTGSAARFLVVSGIVLDPSGNVYAVDANTIRKVTPAGVVITLAGSAAATGPSTDGLGAAAVFSGPTGAIASDGAGNLYVSDNCSIRKVTATGVVTTVIGLAGECGIRLGAAGRIYSPFALAVLNAKRLLIGSHDALLIADLP